MQVTSSKTFCCRCRHRSLTAHLTTAVLPVAQGPYTNSGVLAAPLAFSEMVSWSICCSRQGKSPFRRSIAAKHSEVLASVPLAARALIAAAVDMRGW